MVLTSNRVRRLLFHGQRKERKNREKPAGVEDFAANVTSLAAGAISGMAVAKRLAEILRDGIFYIARRCCVRDARALVVRIAARYLARVRAVSASDPLFP